MPRQIRIQKQTRRPRFSALLSALTVLGLLVLMSVPAFASSDHEDHGKGKDKKYSSDHDGDADSDSDTAYTEDNDTNDGGTPNNVSDEGDNRHPSGKDRSVEHGNSGNQGKSESDPDGDDNGGADKPNGSGGYDKADQDGNNGCGNDDDFEDDNNGNCGGHKKDDDVKGDDFTDERDCKDRDHTSDDDDDDDDVVAPVTVPHPAKPELAKPEAKDKVLPKVIRRAPAVPAATVVKAAVLTAPAAVLPRTGGPILGYLFAGLGLMAAGTVALRAKK